MNSSGQGTEKAWKGEWMPIDSVPPDGEDVLVVVRDRDGDLIYRIGCHWAEYEPDPVEGTDGKPFWSFENEFWDEESLIKWRPLPPI